MNYRLSNTTKPGWMILYRDADNNITEISIFKNDDYFLKTSNSKTTTEAINHFKKIAMQDKLAAVILEFDDFASWGLEPWIKNELVMIRAKQLGWVVPC